MAASFTLSARVPAGKVTVRDIAGLYVYENTLCVLEVTGAQVKAALEHAAKFFRDYIIAHARGAANQVRMGIGLLKEMPIDLPPLHAQHRIACSGPQKLDSF